MKVLKNDQKRGPFDLAACARELPGTLRRSPAKAQRTVTKAHDCALAEYGDEARAHRVAYSALERSFERRGDRWVAKPEPGPSDPRARDPRAREDHGRTFGGVDVEGNTRAELYERARALSVPGRARMSKTEPAAAIARRQ